MASESVRRTDAAQPDERCSRRKPLGVDVVNAVAVRPIHVYKIRPRKNRRVVVVDLISDVLPFSRLWYGEPNAASNAIGYAKFYSRSHDAVIRVYDDAGNVIETHEHTCQFNEREVFARITVHLPLKRIFHDSAFIE
jgi:hypothetical protein